MLRALSLMTGNDGEILFHASHSVPPAYLPLWSHKVLQCETIFHLYRTYFCPIASKVSAPGLMFSGGQLEQPNNFVY